MPETILWILLEVAVALALVPCVYGIVQWNHRRITEKAIRALSQRVKQSEAERKHTLTAILTGAHHLPESESAALATSLILSERAFFRHCFTTLISQDKAAIEQFAENLYGVLDDYLRKCAKEHDRVLPREVVSVAAEPKFEAAAQLAPAPAPAPIPVPVQEPDLEPEPEEEEIDWDAAFADLDNAPAPTQPLDNAESSLVMEPMLGTESAFVDDAEEPFFDAAGEAAETPSESEEDALPQSEEDIMAAWGEAFEEQAESSKKATADDDFDLGWDDAFLEETVVISEATEKDLKQLMEQ